jgi:predicted O-methyltransferase YrrM
MNTSNLNIQSPDQLSKKNSHLKLMIDFLEKKKNPIILELGVERGTSTKAFVWFAEQNDATVYSVDIADCSKVIKSEKWNFIQSNDLHVDFILEKFKNILTGGVDLIYIDSYHENFHVLKLLNIWFKYLKKDGAIFVDDVDSFPFRKKADTWNSIVYDLTDEIIKEFYYNNEDKIFYTRYYGENGLAKLQKQTNLFDEPNSIKKIWNYNPIIKHLYPHLRKLKKLFK